MGVETVVEASDMGRGLYSLEGFIARDRYATNLPEKWADRGRQEFTWMVMPVTSTKDSAAEV